MFLSSILFGVVLASQARACGHAATQPPRDADFTNNVVFRPGPDYSSWGTIYARSVQLPDTSLLLTWESYPLEPPLVAFPIWKSTDGGATWNDFLNVTDQVNNWGLRYQPHFYTLDQDLGEYKAGTILLSGMSVPADLSEAWLDVYTSTDNGESWQFVSHISYAPGPETVANGDKAVWEPFFVMRDNTLIYYYSDQRDDSRAQKLVHVTTEDLVTWSGPVDDVAMSDYEARPGMVIVAHIESTDKYIMTYELCGIESNCPAFFKVADSPYTFGDSEGNRVIDNTTSEAPGHAPFVIWTPSPGQERRVRSSADEWRRFWSHLH